MGDERDSGDITEELKAIGHLSKRLKTIASIVSAVVTIGGIGAWVGVLQHTVNQLKTDVADNEKAIKGLPARFEAMEKVELSRLTKLRDASIAQFNSDKDELWEIKNAVSQIRLEIRFRHGERPVPVMVSATPRPTKAAPRRRPTKVEVQHVADVADEALEEMVEPDEGVEDPLGKLTF